VAVKVKPDLPVVLSFSLDFLGSLKLSVGTRSDVVGSNKNSGMRYNCRPLFVSTDDKAKDVAQSGESNQEMRRRKEDLNRDLL
jgi:hypothetical protein